MGTVSEETQEKRTIKMLNGPEIEKGNVVKFRNASNDIMYGVIEEICKEDVWIIVGTDLNINSDDVDTYEIGDFKERFLELLSPGDVVKKLNIVRQTVA